MSASAASSITWEQYNETGRRLFAEGDLAGAEDAFVAAIAEAERAGGDPLQLASSLGNLAQLKYQQKDHLRAEDLFRRSLELREQSLGSEHPSVLTSINNLAALYVSRGALDEAEPLLKRAMTASAKRVDSAQTDLGVNLNNLARLYFKRGDYRQAEPLLLQLLTLKRPYGPEHPEVATVLVSLAKVRHALGKPDQAERLWRRVLIVRERQLPASDPAVLQSMDGLSDSLAALGKHAAALELRERALKAREEAMGAGHPTVAQARAKVDESRATASATPIVRNGNGALPTPAALKSATRIPTPTAPKPPAPPPAAAAPAPVPVVPEPDAAVPANNALQITEAWADDPALPPPKPNRVSDPIRRVSNAVPVAAEPTPVAAEPIPVAAEPTKEVELGVTQVFERVTKTPTPTPAPLAVTRTPTPPPSPSIERKPRIGFGAEAEGSKKMFVIAGGAIAAVLVIGALILVPKMSRSAPPAPAPSATMAAAPATKPTAQTPAPPVAETPAQPQAAQPATATPAPAPVETASAAPESQPRGGFSAHMGPAVPPPAAAEPDSSTEHARPTPKSGSIKLSRGSQAPAANDVALPSAPSLNLDEATKVIDSTTKAKKKKGETVAVPSF